QCGRLTVPPIAAPVELATWLAALPPGTPLVVADEAGGEPPLTVLRRLPEAILLVGPEGGFAPADREQLAGRPDVVPVGLGRHVLRSETAALFLLVAHRLAGEASVPTGPRAG
ncbi:MAG: RsmE family RNA methyltransferase, partial [Geminicoccaceae bacterium]|nr:RsmE family RNA methyltransferase [Geminicoccaceae bacterium]